jgi:hypothetical protein
MVKLWLMHSGEVSLPNQIATQLRTAERLPHGTRALVFQLVAEESLERLRGLQPAVRLRPAAAPASCPLAQDDSNES